MSAPASITPVYAKLPGTGTNALQQVWLYLGPDHLLQVTSNGFSESYQRFYFRDIQAIAFHHTHAGQMLNLLFAGLAFLSLLPGMAIGNGAIIVFGIVAVIWMTLLGVNVARGPTCATYLTTAVQTRRLPSLNRIPRALKVIDRLRPLIATAQGELPSAPVPPQSPEPGSSPVPPPGPPAGPSGVASSHEPT